MKRKTNETIGPDRGYSGLARVLAVLVLLVTAATGAWAVAWTGGTYTATTNEELSAINVSSDATLTINSNVTVTVNGGITIASGATLTVKGPGTLEVKGGNGNDGSSDGDNGNPGGNGGAAVSGTIVVQDGANVMATGGKGGNGGVGGETSGNGGNGGEAFSGAVTIYDGTISASGGNGGDGDGGSGDGSDGGPGGDAFKGTLTYYGGSVTATGGNGGGGMDGDANPGKAFSDANSVSFQANYTLTSNGSAIHTIGGQQQITIAAPPVAVTGVTLPSTATVTLGDAVALTAAVAPADASDKKVKWTVTAGTDKVKLYKDAECKTEVGTDATDVLTVYAKGLAVGEATVKVESNEDETKTATCAVTAKHGTYAVAMKAGVTDGDQWTARAGGSGDFAAMPLKGVEGGTKPVELKYAGDREVKRVTMRVVPAWKGDLSKLSATELEDDGVTVLVKNGMTLTGTLSARYKITIAAGATVTLDGVTINGVDYEYKWAGLNCLGDATIILKDGSVNTVKGFFRDYPGIHVPSGKTLTIKGGSEGTGKLTASPFDGGTDNSYGAGIGGGYKIACGNISIKGGTVTATGGNQAAGIGGGYNASCGNITITDGVTKVTATKGDSDAPYSIGAGQNGTCGTVTIGGTVYYDGSDYQNDGATYLAQDEIEYPTPVAFAANEYNEASWDGSKVVFTKKTAATTPTAVANSNTAVTWSDGWYTVAGEVTINGTITLNGDVNLIIKDGAKLTANKIAGGRNNLRIYGQAQMTGELVVSCSNSDAISALSTLEVHSAKVTATSSNNVCGGFNNIVTFNVYGGLVDAKATDEVSGYGISLKGGGSMNIYGGEVKAEGTGDINKWGCGIVCGDSFEKATVTVYGGKLWSRSAEKAALYSNITLAKGEGFNGKIETSADNSAWAEYTGDDTPTTKYVRVGY